MSVERRSSRPSEGSGSTPHPAGISLQRAANERQDAARDAVAPAQEQIGTGAKRDTAHRRLGSSFELHGKTISGTLAMGTVYAIEFTDGTSLWITGSAPLAVDLTDTPI